MKTKVIHITFDGREFEDPHHARAHEKHQLLVALLDEQLRAMFVASEFPDRVRATPETTAYRVAEVLGSTILAHALLSWNSPPAVRQHLRQLVEQQLGGYAEDLSLED